MKKCIQITFLLLSFLPLTLKATDPATLRVIVTEIDNNYDCDNDASGICCGCIINICDPPEPRWKAQAGYSNGNFGAWTFWNGGNNTCAVYNGPDQDLLGVSGVGANVGTATQFNVNAETWEEDGTGGVSGGCAYYACGDVNWNSNYNASCCFDFCGWFNVCFDGDDVHWGPARLANIDFRSVPPCTTADWGWWYTRNGYGFHLNSYYTLTNPPTWNVPPTANGTDFTICPGIPLSFTASVNNSDGHSTGFAWRWQYWNGSAWVGTGMPTTSDFSFTATNNTNVTITTYYRLQVTSDCNGVFSAANTLTSSTITVNVLGQDACFASACNTYFVDPVNGNDLNASGPNTPWKTLWKALSVIGNNNTDPYHIKIAKGTTPEPANFPIIMQSNVLVEGGYLTGATNTDWRKTSDPANKTTIGANYNWAFKSGRVGIIAGLTGATANTANTCTNWRLQDLTISVPTSATSAYSTYGVYISGASSYEIVRCDITSYAASTGGAGSYGVYCDVAGAGTISDTKLTATTGPGVEYALAQSGGTAPTQSPAATFVVNSTLSAGTVNNPTNTELLSGTVRSNFLGRYCINSEIDMTKAGNTWNGFPQATSGVGSLYIVDDLKAGVTSYGTGTASIKAYATVGGGFDLGFSAGVLKKFVPVASSTEYNRTVPVISASPSSVCVGGNGVALSITSGSFDVSFIKDREWAIYTDAQGPNTPLFRITGPFATAPVIGPFNSAGTYNVRYRERHDCCGWSRPTYTTITVVADPTAPTVTRDPNLASICEGGQVRADITFPSDGVSCSNTLQYSIDNGAWTAYTNNTYIGSTATGSIKIRGYRDCSAGNGCTPAVFTEQLWTIVDQPSVFSQPQPVLACNGGTAYISMSAVGGVGLQYQWQSNTTSCAASFTNEGSASSSSIHSIPTTTNGVIYYKAVVTSTSGSGCNTITSSCATATIGPQPSSGPVTKSPNVTAVCSGSSVSASFSSGSDGVGCSDIQQYRYDGTGAWSTYTGALSTTGHTKVEIQNYRGNCDASSGCSDASPTLVSWDVVTAPVSGTLTKSPNVATVCTGATVSASQATAGTDGIGCSDFIEYRTKSVATGLWSAWTIGTSVLTTTAMSEVEIRAYRGNCTANSGCTDAAANTVSWIVTPQPTLSNPVLSSPKICLGDNFTLNSTLSGGVSNNTPVWEFLNGTYATVAANSPAGASYSSTTGNITVSGISNTGSYTYRYNLPVNSLNCSATSNPVTIEIIPTLSPGTINNTDQLLCNGTPSAIGMTTTPTGANGFYDYKWYQNTNASPTCPGAGVPEASLGASGWTVVTTGSGYNTSNFTPPSTSGTITYLLTVDPTGTPDCGGFVTAAQCQKVQVYPVFDRGTLGGNYQICNNTIVAPLTFTTPVSGGNGLAASYTYTWYYQDANVTPVSGILTGWSTTGSIATGGGTNTLTVTAAQTVANRTYACWVDYTGSPDCGVGNWATGKFLFTVTAATAPANPAALTTCSATSPTDNTPNLVIDPPGLPIGATVTYEWKYRAASVACGAINYGGASVLLSGTGVNNDPVLNIGNGNALPVTYTFMRKASVTCGGPPTTQYTCVTVTTAAFNGGTLASSGQNICYNTTPSDITYSAAPSGSAVREYQWYYQTGTPSCPSGNFSATGWTAIGPVSTTTPTLTGATVGNLTATTTFALRVKDISTVACFDKWSGTCHVVTVRPVFNGGTISSGTQSVCNNTAPVDITYSAAPSGGSTPSYQWYQLSGTQSCPSGAFSIGSWSLISGATAVTLPGATIGNLSATTTYALRVRDVGTPACYDNWSGTCQVVDVLPTFSSGTIDNGVSYICDNDPAPIAQQTAPAGGVSYQYQWYYLDGDQSASCPSGTTIGSWNLISGATSASYDPPPIAAVRTYARTVKTTGSPSCNPTETWSASCRVVYPGSYDPNSIPILATTNSSSTININDNNWHFFINASCQLIAAVHSKGQNLGNVTMAVNVDSTYRTFGNGGYGREQYCLNKPELAMGRFFTMTTQNTPASTTIVRLYYNNNDFNAYTAAILALPYVSAYDICYGYPNNPTDIAISRNTTVDWLIDSTQVICAVCPNPVYAHNISLSPGSLRVGGPEGSTAGPTTYHFHTDGGIGLPLPVELVSFVGWNEGDYNQLQWTTASEKDTYKFIVEKSTAATTNWTAIGEVPGAGNSNAVLTYNLTDNNPVVGNNYYRLKILDVGGNYEYSNMINIPISTVSKNAFIGIYPNPTSGLLNIDIQAMDKSNTELKVYDILGQLVTYKDISLVPGLNKIQMNYTSLAKASYILSYVDNAGIQHQIKFVKD